MMPALAAIVASERGPRSAVVAVGVQAKRADAFVDSIAVNIHMDAFPANAHFSDIIIPTVQALGIRTVRSGFFGTGADAPIALTKQLAAQAGVRYILVSNPVAGGSYSNQAIQSYMMARIDPAIVWIAEGPNEVDNNYLSWGGTSSNPALYWGANVATFETSRAAYFRANYPAIKLSSPSVTSNFGATALGNMSSTSDYGTAHPYPWGQGSPPGPVEPGAGLQGLLTTVSPIIGSMGNRRWVVTETGYQTSLTATSPSYLVNQGISQTAQQKYVPRLVAENFMQDVDVTALYELTDDANDATYGESNFGLVKVDGTRKAVATTLANLIALLSERTFVQPAYVIGSAYIAATFAVANQSGWPTATGTDTAKTWVDGNGAESSHWTVVSGKGVAAHTGDERNIIGDAHGAGASAGEELYWSADNIRVGFSQNCELMHRFGALNDCYVLSVNPGVANQLQLVKNHATTLAYTSKASISTLSTMKVRFWAINLNGDVQLFARAWDATTTEPTTWDLQYTDVGGVASVGTGDACLRIDTNGSGQFINTLAFTYAPITFTAGAMPALPAFTPGKLNYSITDASGTVRSSLLQKADGSFWLSLWQRVSVFNPSTKTDISNANVSVALTFNDSVARTGTSYLPSAGLTGTGLGSHTTFTLAVPDEVMLVRFV